MSDITEPTDITKATDVAYSPDPAVMAKPTDKLFSAPQKTSPFKFDRNVAEVFPDMIERSVPGYAEILSNLSLFAQKHVQSNSNCYDLGCSLGAASLAMCAGIEQNQTITAAQIIAVDNSAAMLERCQQHIAAFRHKTPITLLQQDIQKLNIKNASMVVLNFTLQFVAKSERAAMLKQVFDGMNSGGLLVISEKIRAEDRQDDQQLIELHHQFKKDNGYSQLEISQKRNALENVLVPETLQQHQARLKQIGFSRICCWFQHFNFVSLFAIK